MELDWYEIIGFITGVLCVALLIRQNIWNWPIAVVNAVFYIVVFFQSKLYADVGLQFVFIVINLYGWYEWLYGGPRNDELLVTRMSLMEIVWSGVGVAFGTWAVGAVLANYTDAALPYVDSLATVISLTAQFHMARKRLENWILWIGVNGLYIGIYFSRGLFLTQVLYVIYFVLAVMGYRAWLKSMQEKIEPVN